MEFVSPQAAVGNAYVREFGSVETRFGKIKLLLPVDSLKDRLSAFYHLNDRQGLEQAINSCLGQNDDHTEVERWSSSKGYSGKYTTFPKQLEKAKSSDSSARV